MSQRKPTVPVCLQSVTASQTLLHEHKHERTPGKSMRFQNSSRLIVRPWKRGRSRGAAPPVRNFVHACSGYELFSPSRQRCSCSLYGVSHGIHGKRVSEAGRGAARSLLTAGTVKSVPFSEFLVFFVFPLLFALPAQTNAHKQKAGGEMEWGGRERE